MNYMTYSSYNSFSTISSISISVNNSNFTSVFFKAAYDANPGAEKNFGGSKWQIFKHIFLTSLKTLAKSNVSLLKYKSWYSPQFFISKSLQSLLACM